MHSIYRWASGKRAGTVVDEPRRAQLQRRIIAGSRRVSCNSREAKTAGVYPPSPPSLYPPSPNIKGSLWHGLGCAARLAGDAVLRAIYNTASTPGSELGKPPTLFFHFSLIISHPALLLSDTHQHAPGPFASEFAPPHIVEWLGVQREGPEVLPRSLLSSALQRTFE